MLDLTTIILTYNEEIHIRRCLENVRMISKRILVIDCHSTDKTVDIALANGAEVIEHDWPGNQAEQFNWVMDNVSIDSEWVLRLDADEYLTEGLIDEMNDRLPSMDSSVSAVILPLGRAFQGRILKHGIVNGIRMIRLFRKGKARYDYRVMDEKFIVLDGDTVSFKNKFIDDNRCSISQFIAKHNIYSSREAAMLLDEEYHLSESDDSAYSPDSLSLEAIRKRGEKARYLRMPLFLRSFAYYLYRRYLKLGILDGKEGFLWDFFQGLWYRMLVDAKIFSVKKSCGGDKEMMKEYIRTNFGISL